MFGRSSKIWMALTILKKTNIFMEKRKIFTAQFVFSQTITYTLIISCIAYIHICGQGLGYFVRFMLLKLFISWNFMMQFWSHNSLRHARYEPLFIISQYLRLKGQGYNMNMYGKNHSLESLLHSVVPVINVWQSQAFNESVQYVW